MVFAVIVILLFFLLLLRIPIGFALAITGLALLIYGNFNLIILPQLLYGSIDKFELLAVPLFLLMSNILLKAGYGKDLFSCFQSWVGHLPGGLSTVSILSCGFFSSICGSSVATASTIGTVAIPEMIREGYKKNFVLGLLASGGTLGILIPPSIPLILYGVIAEQSIAKLFIGGIGPAIILILLLILYSFFSSYIQGVIVQKRCDYRERIRKTIVCFPVFLIALSIIITIYGGIATPTESAAISFILAFFIAILSKRINFEQFKCAIRDAMETTTVVFFIIMGAKIFSYAITIHRFPQDLSYFILSYINSPSIFILCVTIIVLILGLFLETLSMLLIMVPIFLVSVETYSIDPLWFGIFFVILIEIALITPPIGLNLFVIKSIGNSSLQEVVSGVWPFLLTLLIMIFLIYLFPEIILFLPNQL